MQTKEITFNISRFKAGFIDPERLATYVVSVREDMTVLDVLEKIRLEQEPTLVYRHSCHHGSCGTCACIVNETERLACATRVWDLEEETVTLAPLRGFGRIADLAIDAGPVFQDISPAWTCLQPAEAIDKTQPAFGTANRLRFENCIECGSCVSACPVSQGAGGFMGPAALAAIHREMVKSPDKKEELLRLAGGKRGEHLCQRALACSRVCPSNVYPARHIADLRRTLKK